MAKERLQENDIRVRYAPSPTGVPHVGNIRTALFNYFHARGTGGEFLLRIEDTDQARKIEGAVEAIEESLTWLGAEWDDYIVQSERIHEYRKFAQELVEKGKAREEDGAVRFIVPKDKNEDISWIDAIGQRVITFKASEIEDFIILKSDGYPTYHLANVIDDNALGITHVIRGDDWISSTPKHILLYRAFGWEPPIFAHVPNVLGEDGKKLSKRRGAKSVLEYQQDGFVPEALLNYLMLLGWSPKNDRTIVTKKEIEEEFSLESVSVAPAIFNERKLIWINGEYIRSFDNEELERRLREFDPDLSKYDAELVAKLVEPAKSRIKTLSDFRKLILPFVKDLKLPPSDIRRGFGLKMAGVDNWNKDEIVKALKNFVTEKNIGFKDLYEAVIGEKQGLPLADTFEILGKERTLLLLGR